MSTGRGRTLAIQAGFTLGLGAILFLFWESSFLYPLKMLVVFFHELSHGLAAILTGGSIVDIQLDYRQGGLCTTRGGILFVVFSAGYLGSLLFGIAIYLAAVLTRYDRPLCAALGGLILLITLLFVRNLFGFAFCLCTGLALLLCARFLGEMANDLILRVIGMTSMFYAPLDIIDDVIHRSHLPSDGYMLAQMFFPIPILGNTIFWGFFWVFLSLGLMVGAILIGIGVKSQSKGGESFL